jgi:hypothetical protein
MMIEATLAGLTLAVCALLLVRLVLPARHRQRVDAAARRGWFRLRVRAVTLWRWRRLRREADEAAREAIERASRRADGEWKGNVYEPKSFRKPRKPH